MYSYNNFFIYAKKGSQRGVKLISTLSVDLQNEVIYEAYGKILKDINLFKESFSNEFLNSLCIKMKEVTYAPDEIICLVLIYFFTFFNSFLKDNNKDLGIYYIMSGEVFSYNFNINSFN